MWWFQDRFYNWRCWSLGQCLRCDSLLLPIDVVWDDALFSLGGNMDNFAKESWGREWTGIDRKLIMAVISYSTDTLICPIIPSSPWKFEFSRRYIIPQTSLLTQVHPFVGNERNTGFDNWELLLHMVATTISIASYQSWVPVSECFKSVWPNQQKTSKSSLKKI